jgi:hypothetical protein
MNRRGFSFAEVMFAVIVLGIGFIMIAAIFPVAISQTQASLSDTAGVTVGRTGSIYMANLIGQGTGTIGLGDVKTYATYTASPPPLADGIVHPIDGVATMVPSRWDRMKGNFIETADPRFAWVPIGYKMADESAGTFGAVNSIPRYAEFYVLAVQSQVKPTFDRLDLDPPAAVGAAPFDVANLRPKTITGVLIQDSTDPANTDGVDTVTFPAATAQPSVNCVASGAYILVSNDHLDTSPSPVNAKLMNGQYYRIGANIRPNVWELQPGNDFSISPGRDGVLGTGDDISQIPAADVMIVGRGFNPSATPPTEFEGAAMDLFMLPPVIVQLPLSAAP